MNKLHLPTVVLYSHKIFVKKNIVYFSKKKILLPFTLLFLQIYIKTDLKKYIKSYYLSII